MNEEVGMQRRDFLKKFAIGAAVVPVMAASGCFGIGHGHGNETADN